MCCFFPKYSVVLQEPPTLQHVPAQNTIVSPLYDTCSYYLLVWIPLECAPNYSGTPISMQSSPVQDLSTPPWTGKNSGSSCPRMLTVFFKLCKGNSCGSEVSDFGACTWNLCMQAGKTPEHHTQTIVTPCHTEREHPPYTQDLLRLVMCWEL